MNFEFLQYFLFLLIPFETFLPIAGMQPLLGPIEEPPNRRTTQWKIFKLRSITIFMGVNLAGISRWSWADIVQFRTINFQKIFPSYVKPAHYKPFGIFYFSWNTKMPTFLIFINFCRWFSELQASQKIVESLFAPLNYSYFNIRAMGINAENRHQLKNA